MVKASTDHKNLRKCTQWTRDMHMPVKTLLKIPFLPSWMLLKLGCTYPVCWVHLFYFICQSPVLTPIPRRTENGGTDYQSKLNPGALFFSSNSVPPKPRRTEDGGAIFFVLFANLQHLKEKRERAQLVPDFSLFLGESEDSLHPGK